ncbi:FMN-binding protein [Kitasatospora sp. NPDC057936]|uniref:FMN-binding protein n=1 Tax=Kitasatospora sp. NPDC057936 TaxID=3346283 RepID=UPI0036DC0CC2
MRRAVVVGSATAAGVILLLSLKPHQGAASAAAPISSGSSGSSGGSGGSGGTSGTSSAPPAQASDTSGTRAITGDSVDTRYGPVQVKVTLAGKKITRIDVVRYPSESGRDRSINSYALPVLNQEAISAQSAAIDVVSGATYTSDGYTRSLQSALDKAGS